MEVILSIFFERLDAIERNCLHSRCNRRAMVDYFNTLIEGCRLGEECDSQVMVREAILGIIKYHNDAKKENGNVCIMGKYHNVLYVALKIAYDWQLSDTEVLKNLLEMVFECEKTFERIMVGALFGIRAPHFIAGWKSDFENQEENLRAIVFYLNHSNDSKALFVINKKPQRFIDIPIESCGKCSPVKILVQLGLPDKLLIFLRFGALVDNDFDAEESVVDVILEKLSQYKGKYSYNFVACLQIILRVIPCLFVGNRREYSAQANVVSSYVLDNFAFLVDDCILPLESCAILPAKLKHLCRCKIRNALWLNHQLPNGIQELPVPVELKRYIDILLD